MEVLTYYSFSTKGNRKSVFQKSRKVKWVHSRATRMEWGKVKHMRQKKRKGKVGGNRGKF